MKTKRLILVAVLLTAVGLVLFHFRSDIWLPIAYVERPIPAQGNIEDAFLDGMHYLDKRFAWIPGRRALLPAQTCGSCLGARHNQCLPWLRLQVGTLPAGLEGLGPSLHDPEAAYRVMDDGTVLWRVRCTCPDPLHRPSR